MSLGGRPAVQKGLRDDASRMATSEKLGHVDANAVDRRLHQTLRPGPFTEQGDIAHGAFEIGPRYLHSGAGLGARTWVMRTRANGERLPARVIGGELDGGAAWNTTEPTPACKRACSFWRLSQCWFPRWSLWPTPRPGPHSLRS